MERPVKKGPGFGNLNHTSQIHDYDPVADMFNHAEVMADEQIGQIHVVFQVHEQIEDLGLDGHIQGSNGFVTDNKVGLHSQGPGNTDPLALARKTGGDSGP